MLSPADVEHIVQQNCDRGPLRQLRDTQVNTAYSTTCPVDYAATSDINEDAHTHIVGKLVLRHSGERRTELCFTEGDTATACGCNTPPAAPSRSRMFYAMQRARGMR